MEYRALGNSGLQVPLLSFGTGTFGGTGPVFGAWGNSDAAEARRMIDICLDAGITLFDTADSYSGGAAERILGEAVRGRRERVLLATKVGLPAPTGAVENDWGVSPHRLPLAVDASLARLGVDYIDLLQLHAYDAATPTVALLETLAALMTSGKVRHVGVSNYPGWQLMKALALAESGGLPRMSSHQVYYSLVGRAYEADLMPLGLDQNVAALIWSPLGWGRLTGKVKPGTTLPAGSRLNESSAFAPPVADAVLGRVLSALAIVADDTGRSVPQIALNWLTGRPTVASVIVGARNETQLRDNIGAVGWHLDAEHVALLDQASVTVGCYPHTLYAQPGPFRTLNPPVV